MRVHTGALAAPSVYTAHDILRLAQVDIAFHGSRTHAYKETLSPLSEGICFVFSAARELHITLFAIRQSLLGYWLPLEYIP